jgi:hypothetical protein
MPLAIVHRLKHPALSNDSRGTPSCFAGGGMAAQSEGAMAQTDKAHPVAQEMLCRRVLRTLATRVRSYQKNGA